MPSIPPAPTHDRARLDRRQEWLAPALLTAAFLGVVAVALGAAGFEWARLSRKAATSDARGAAAAVVFASLAVALGLGMGYSLWSHRRDLLRLMATEEAVRVSERRLRFALEKSRTGGWELDASTRTGYRTETHARIFGHDRSDASWSFGQFLDHVLPEDRPEVERRFRDARAAESDWDFECRIRRADGVIRWVWAAGGHQRGADGTVRRIAGIVQDITDRKEAEQARRQEREFSDVVLDSLPGVLYCYDENLQFRRWNRSFERVTGYSSAEVAAMSPLEFFAPEDRDRVAARIREVLDGGVSEVEADFVAKDGSRTPFYFNGLATIIEGRRHLVGVGLDISRRKRDEDEIRRLNAELRRHAAELERRVSARTAELEVTRDRAEAADRLKSAFLATMSHELRTPLNSIIGFTGILLQGLAGPLTAEQARQLGMVRASARHLLELINDILDLSKIEAGQLQVHAEPFDVGVSVERVCGVIRPLAEQKALALDVDVPPSLGAITSDRRRVEQVLLNLLNNAVKFTPAGRITVTARRLQDAVTITVADTGIGIAPADLDTLFQPFRQVDSGLTRQHEGTGLGLAICRGLLERLRGTLTVESTPGSGSAFTVTLPLAPGAEVP